MSRTTIDKKAQPTLYWLVFIIAGLVLFGFTHAAVAKEYSEVRIVKQSSKTPVAVTEFKLKTGYAAEENDARKAQKILKNALNFTGYLKTMNPMAFLSNPAESGISLGEINFRDWKDIGAELLITGGIKESGGKVTMELRLFDTWQSKLLVGRIYSGPRDQVRKMIHKFCSEISYALTGQWGIFTSKIAYVSKVNGNKEIYTCDFDGENKKQETFHKSISLSPAWSHDGQWLAYVSYARGSTEIFIKNLAGKRGAIVNYKGTNSSPDWMPESLNLAAAMTFSGDPEIYLLTKKGKIIKRITKSWGIDVSPKFSSDGRKIAFTSRRHGSPQIYIKDINSGFAKRVTFRGNNNTSPAWSPDGRKIAYVGIEGNQINIFVVDVESGKTSQLTSDAGDNEDPCWSPDGTMIAFTSSREYGVQRIFVMTASGMDQRRLFKARGSQTEPDWSMSRISNN